MGVQSTVVFADLFGSTKAFETLGNARATQAVTQITSWIATTVEAHGGRVVKMLGDGVLALFGVNQSAINLVVELQRVHQLHLSETALSYRMPIRIGVASGEVELVAGDCYGDAVNVAARLSDLCGPHQIWANSAALAGAVAADGVHFHELGPVMVRGRAEPCAVYQIEWQEDLASSLMTMQAAVDSRHGENDADALGGQIELNWLDSRKKFHSFELPIHIGRMRQAEFVVNDPRVSRSHARVEWRNGGVILVDLSSYGCWVRFAGGGADLALRREECVLHGSGEIALGSSFSDPTTPTLRFSVS